MLGLDRRLTTEGERAQSDKSSESADRLGGGGLVPDSEVNVERPKPLNQFLRMAVMAGVESAVQLHIERGDDLNARDASGMTQLSTLPSASADQRRELLQLLAQLSHLSGLGKVGAPHGEVVRHPCRVAPSAGLGRELATSREDFLEHDARYCHFAGCTGLRGGGVIDQ